LLDKDVIKRLLDESIKLWPERWPTIEKYFQRSCFAAAVDAIMWDIGLFKTKNEIRTIEEIISVGAIVPEARYVLEKLLDILTEEGVIKKEADKYICVDNDPDVSAPTECLVEAVKEVPEEWAAFQWLSRGIGGISRFLKGRLSGEEVMFGPWGDFTLVGQVYYTSKVYCFWSKIAGATLTEITKGAGKKLTILEVGAGTGSGTTEFFNTLGEPRDYIEKYIFTDIFKKLVKNASKTFADKTDFMEFKTLDLSKPLQDQGFDKESVDILYAVNVMHALNDIKVACETMFDIIRKGGMVVLGEISPAKGKLYRYMELTFGLLGSYSQYDDKDLRPLSPILRPEEWIDNLKKAGFSDAIAIPGDRLEGLDRGGAVVVKK